MPFATEIAEMNSEINRLTGVLDAKSPNKRRHQQDFRKRLANFNAQLEQERQNREALIKACHPSGVHFPPHDDCPICQKIFQKYETLARRWCEDNGLDWEDFNYGSFAVAKAYAKEI